MSVMTVTRDAFERHYAERSGMTVPQLHAWGRYAEPCACDYVDCEGWVMGFPWEEALIEDRLQRQRCP